MNTERHHLIKETKGLEESKNERGEVKTATVSPKFNSIRSDFEDSIFIDQNKTLDFKAL